MQMKKHADNASMDHQDQVADVRSRGTGGTDTRRASCFCFRSRKCQQVGAGMGGVFEFDEVAQMIYWKQWINEELTVPV